MPKAFELGIRGPIPSHDRVPGTHVYGDAAASPSRNYLGGDYGRGGYGGIAPPSSREQEDYDLQRAIDASLRESRQYLSTKDPATPDDRSAKTAPAPQVADLMLMDFAQPTQPSGGPPPDAQSVMSYNTMPPSYNAPPPGHPLPQQPPPPNAYQPGPGYASQPPPNSYQSPPPPSSSNALVPSGAPSQPYALSPASQQYNAPAPAAPSYGAPPQAAPSYGAPPQAHPYSYSAPPPAAPAYAPAAPPAPAYGVGPPNQAAPKPETVPTGDLFAPPPADPFAPPPAQPGAQYGFGPAPIDDPFAPRPPPPPTRDDITKSVSAFQSFENQAVQLFVGTSLIGSVLDS
jgi:hypothetical protein